jgi:hypothetical protein
MEIGEFHPTHFHYNGQSEEDSLWAFLCNQWERRKNKAQNQRV